MRSTYFWNHDCPPVLIFVCRAPTLRAMSIPRPMVTVLPAVLAALCLAGCDGETAEFCPTPSVDVAAMTSRGHVIAPMEFAGQ